MAWKRNFLTLLVAGLWLMPLWHCHASAYIDQNKYIARVDVVTITPTGTPPSILTSLIPQPTKAWHGRKQPDYNGMYWDYTVGLFCLRHAMGYGILGFYVWFLELFKLGQSLISVPTAERSWLAVSHGTLGTALFLYDSITSSIAVRACGNEEITTWAGYQVQDYTSKVAIFYLIDTIGSGLASFAEMNFTAQHIRLLSKHPKKDRQGRKIEPVKMARGNKIFVIVCHIVAILFKLLEMISLYLGDTNILYLDSSLLGPILSLIPAVVVLLVVLALIMISFRRIDYFPLAALFIGILVMAHIAMTGLGYILLGRTVDDLYGVALIRGWQGIFQVLLTVLSPFFGIGFLIFGAGFN
jgi:hypothetical protein